MASVVERTGSSLGAVVTGIRLVALDRSEWEAVEDAFHAHAVLIFPEQHLSGDDQVAFARRFGEIEQIVPDRDSVPISNRRPDGTLMADDEPVMQILRGNEGWHTDSSYMPLAA